MAQRRLAEQDHPARALGPDREHEAFRSEERVYESMAQMRGSMNINRCPDPASFAGGNDLNVLHTWR